MILRLCSQNSFSKLCGFILIIIGIIASSSVAIFAMIDVYQGQTEWKEKVGGLKEVSSIPSAQEFLKMDCENLNHLYPEFPSVEVADAWNTRMHECINEQESISDLDVKPNEIDNMSEYDSVTELETLQQMSCDEIIYRNQFGENYLSKESRSYVKDRLQECDEEMKTTEEYAQFRELSCEELVAYDEKLDVINSQQVRDYVAREIIDCKNRNY